MPNEHTVVGLYFELDRYRIPVEYADGRKMVHIYPEHTMTLRAAEYGFDLGDNKTLLDVILHEHFINIDRHHEKFVYNTDEDTAREYLLEQIAVAKQSDTIADPDMHLYPLHVMGHNMSIHVQHCQAAAHVRKKRLATKS